MNAKLIAAFRAERAKQSDIMSQYWPHNMRDALRAARYAIAEQEKQKLIPLELPRYSDETAVSEIPGGDALSIVIRADNEGPSLDDLLNVKLTECRRSNAPECFEHEHQWRKKFWLSRDGVAYMREARGDLYQVEESPNTGYDLAQFADDARGRGMPRYMLPLWGRYQLSAQAARVAEALSEYYGVSAYGYNVQLCDEDGKQIAEESCWGFDSFDYCREEAHAVARHMIEARAKETAGQIKMARNSAKVHASNIRAMIAELRQLRGVDAPMLCATVRTQLASMRAAFRAAIARVREAKRVARAYRGKVPA